MTTPGGQLTPGDDTTPPVYGVPDGAYVGDAGSPNAISELSYMTEESAKAAMRTPIGPSFTAHRDGIWGFFNNLLAIIQGGVNLVVGAVDAVVDGIKSIFNSVGSLFGMSHQDTARVDQARADGERAIVANMSASLEHLDEIQRFGGAWMDYPQFSSEYGDIDIRVLPLTTPLDLMAGTAWIPLQQPLTHSSGHSYGRNTAEMLARASGALELLESGLWVIDFQAAFLQGPLYADRPATVWCHVSPAGETWLPTGPPGQSASGDPLDGQQARDRITGNYLVVPLDQIAAVGRATSYVRTSDTAVGGGNTLFGRVYVYLETGGWKVNLSSMAFTRFGGPATTFVNAQKVNSETLRQKIDALEDTIALSLPGENVPLDLDEAAIQAMVGQASEIEVPDVEVPNE